MSIDDRLHGLVAAYMRSPQFVKTVVGGGYSLVPRGLRHGPAYARYKRRFLVDDANGIDVERLVLATLRSAVGSVPAFRGFEQAVLGWSGSSSELLQAFPLTDKESIKADLERYVSTAFPPRARLQTFTGGSTSMPMTFYLHKGVSRAKELAVFDVMAERFGTDGDGVVLALRGRTVPTAGPGRMWMYEPIKRHLILSSDHLEPKYMPQYVDALRKWKPRYIHAYASALYPLVLWLREQGFDDLLSDVRCVTLVSESVFDYHLAAFKQYFSCPVLVTYGHTERVLLANTLPDDPRYHFWPQYGYFELLDVAGQPVTVPGQVGEIVGTSFDNLVMPFVRYRTGDYAAHSVDPHPSMPCSRVVERIEGRLQEYLVCADHRLITVTTIGAAHVQELEQCLRIQYEQSEPGKVLLRVVPRWPLDEASRLRIGAAIRQKTQGGCEVLVREVDSIELTGRGKQRLLVQHLDVGRYLGSALERAVSFSRATSQPPAAVGGPAPQPPCGISDAEVIASRVKAERFVLMVGTSERTQGGIAAVVSTYRSGGLFERYPVRYVDTHCDGSNMRKSLRFVQGLLTVVGMLLRREVALVHAHVSSGGSFWRKSMLLLAARCFAVPTVFHLHSGGFSKWVARRGRLSRRWIRRTIEASDIVITLNRTTKAWLAEFTPRAQVTVIGNGVVVPPHAVSRSDPRAAGRVLYLGWIYDFKGVYDLLQAWALFRQRFPGWRLSVGGKGEVDRFLAEAQRLGVREDIDFLGWVTGAAKDAQFMQADILVLPSYHEGMPMSVLEAMAYGVAVAASPVGGVVDMMTPDLHGLWLEPGNIQSINDRLCQLAGSPALREQLGAAAREHVVANNSIEAIIDQLAAVYAGVLTSGSHAAQRVG